MEREVQLYFLCGQNRCRSQIAEAYARHLSNGSVIVNSAGLDPSPIHPLTVAIMKEDGIDVSDSQSKKIDMKTFMAATVIVKLCEEMQERCPVVPFGIRNEQWDIPDPLAGGAPSMEDVRKTRDVIKEKVTALLQKYNAFGSAV